jgi:NAD(P)-dependent dehydrogenase (short-subunit alcohol dehydrogenase family)
MEIQGKAAVVTGASRGVGKATALALAARGCDVLVNYSSSKTQAEEVAAEVEAAGVKALAFQADVADDAACRAMMDAAQDAFGRLDILVNNAGTTSFVKHDDLEGATTEVWNRIMGVNLMGPFQCIRAASNYLKASGNAEIVNVSSVAGVAGVGSSVPYCASKAALINLGTTMARALGPEVRVNTVAPGFIEGEWLKAGFGDRYEKVKAGNEAKAVLGKVCQPEDVAAAILAFIEGSDLVTGQTVVCDGGMLIGPKF